MRYWILIAVALAGCSPADVYTQSDTQPLGPDRVIIQGQLCADDPGSSSFPVKLLLMVDVSQRMFAVDPLGFRFANPLAGINALLARYTTQPNVRFGFVTLGAQSKAVPATAGQRFFHAADPEVAQALAQLATPSGTGRDLVSALNEAESFIAADIGASPAGEVLRTRYVVYLLLSGPPVPNVSASDLGAQVAELRNFVAQQGALEFRLEIGFTYYGPLTTQTGNGGYGCYTPAAGDPPCTCSDGIPETTDYCRAQCDIDSGFATQGQNDTAATLYGNAALLGGGTFTEIHCPGEIAFPQDLATAKVRLVRKDIVAFNRNVKLTASGPVPDSDGDGLSDDEERGAAEPLDPQNWDTDGDGLGDGLELRASPRQNPLDPDDRPQSCIDPRFAVALPDSDLDLLYDCEEGILSTRPSVPDTDGDGFPDVLELLAGTVPTSADDRLMDFDADGVTNGTEVVEHTNPRAYDRAVAGAYAYRNRIVFTGRRDVATMEDSDALPGVAFRAASPNVVGGQAYLRWDACASTLAWSDARRTLSPAYLPVPVAVTDSGVYRLTAEFRLPDGTLIDAIWAEVFVTLELMPACSTTPEVVANPLISTSKRSCYDVTFGNIKLMPTLASNGATSGGENHILVFFTEAPEDRLSSSGITKIAEVRVRLQCTDPDHVETCTRSPPSDEIELVDRDFASAVPP